MACKILLFLLFASRNEALLNLLQDGGDSGDGGGSDGAGGGSHYDSHDSRSGDRRGEPDNWKYDIFITITYEWITPTNTVTESLSFPYKTVLSSITSLILTDSNKFKVIQIDDQSDDKSDIFHTDSGGSRDLMVRVTTEDKRELRAYLNTPSFEQSLSNNLRAEALSSGSAIRFRDVNAKLEKASSGSLVKFIVFGLIGLVIAGGVCCYVGKGWKKKWRAHRAWNAEKRRQKWAKPPHEWVSQMKKESNVNCKAYDALNVTNPFIDGTYEGYYREYCRRHSMPPFELRFDMRNNVTGEGSDDVGRYKIDGMYCCDTGRVYLNKTYVRSIGGWTQNLEHTVKIRLEWNHGKEQFEGEWYDNTSRYEGTTGVLINFFMHII
eukprot:80773_1